jgi:hypothetical protein
VGCPFVLDLCQLFFCTKKNNGSAGTIVHEVSFRCGTGSERFLLPSSLFEHVSVFIQFSGYEQVHLIPGIPYAFLVMPINFGTDAQTKTI